MKYKQWLITILVLLPNLVLAGTANLTRIQISNEEKMARVEFSLTQRVSYRIFSLSKPNRVVIDFPQTQLAVNLQKITFSTPLITHIRSGHPDPSTLRLVLDVAKTVQFNMQTLSANKLLLNLHPAAISTPLPVKTAAAPKKSLITAPVAQSITVVIDPGHGGRDSGAVGENGTQEKNVVLAISRRLAELINETPHMHAVLTRNGDYFVPLRERLKLARKGKADLFVAVHADSYFNDRSTGASVYALSHRGATSEAARWLARRDNYSELGGVDLGELEDKSYMLRSVLIDLAQTATTTDSLRLGNSLLDSLDAVTKLHYTRVEQAPFVVLKSPDIPSVLVETGFISNPREEEKLRDERYQHKIAQALFNGIQLYIKKYSAVHI